MFSHSGNSWYHQPPHYLQIVFSCPHGIYGNSNGAENLDVQFYDETGALILGECFFMHFTYQTNISIPTLYFRPPI